MKSAWKRVCEPVGIAESGTRMDRLRPLGKRCSSLRHLRQDVPSRVSPDIWVEQPATAGRAQKLCCDALWSLPLGSTPLSSGGYQILTRF